MSELSSPQNISKATPDQIRKQMRNLAPEMLSYLVSRLTPEEDPEWIEKLKAVIEGLEDRQQLEQVGKALDNEQFLAIIDEHSLIDHENHWKLSPLLVGLSPEAFEDALLAADEAQIAFLQHESVTEPIQHHLTCLCHQIAEELHDYGEDYATIEKDIQFIDVSSISPETLNTLAGALLIVTEHLEELFIPLISKALSLAWHTNRHDLIDQLSSHKDTAHRLVTVYFGSPGSLEEVPTGLFAKLHDLLGHVYGEDPDDPESLNDDEPATEGLTRLGIWYLRDYWELGLLPDLQSADEVDLNLDTHTEQERKAHRGKLFETVQENLKKRGLETVGNLKSHGIYSKSLLIEFLKEG